MDWRSILTFYFSLPLLSLVVEAGEYCRFNSQRTTKYCSSGCCSSSCCLTGYTIAGIVFGCIAFIAFIATIVFCICKQKKRQGSVMNQPGRVMVINTSHAHAHGPQPPAYSATQPLPPGYAPQYNPMYTSVAPPYGFSNGSPPSAFTYNNPNNSAFSAATAEAYGSNNGGAPTTNNNPFAAMANANKDTKDSK